MLNRVASSAGARTMLGHLQTSNLALLKAQEQLATGRRINRVSDAPADAVSSLGQRANLRRLEQFGRNAEASRSWLDAGDAALASVSDRLASVRSLVVQANSAASDPTSRAALAGEIRSLREALLQTANTQQDGRQIFAGTTATTASYTSAGIYQGNAGTVTIPVSPGITLQVNRTGPDVFGTHNVSDPTAGDVFQLLDSLATAVQNGDQTAMTNGLALVDTASTRVATAQVELGTRSRQLEDLVAANEDTKVSLSTGISKAENVDFAESVVNLKTQEAAYQAALQATAKVLQPTLLDFLR